MGKTSEVGQKQTVTDDPFFSMDAKRNVSNNMQNVSPLHVPHGVHGIGYP